ncbi:MAG: hypothetical protein LRS48_00645 [Desulfurococcales archaeon]|nr:hypothetical protein [Desulfurococcales archaeon]
MPGTLARLYMFNSGRDAERFLQDIAGKLGTRIKYSSVRLFNKNYDLDKDIDLLVFVARKRVTTLYETGEEYYRFKLDIPVTHISLEGEWRVKEARTVDFLVYDTEGLDRIALALSDRKDVYKHFETALTKFSSYRPRRAVLNMHDPALIEEITQKIGEIQWVFLNNIQDPRVTQAMFRGRRLEESEIVQAMSELGKITGLIIYDKQRDIRITLGNKGSLYTSRNISAPDMARTLARTLLILVEHNLLVPKNK